MKMEQLWRCRDCAKLDMRERGAFDHAERYQHCVMYQTEEDIMELKAKLEGPRPYDKNRVWSFGQQAAIDRVEEAMGESLYDPTKPHIVIATAEHLADCRRTECFNAYLDAAVRRSEGEI